MASKATKVIGGKKNFWLWSKESGFDLTHPVEPSASPSYPRIVLNTETEQITIDPGKTGLVVGDMQNYFLSPLLGRPSSSPGLDIVDKLVQDIIPACRRANIPVIWVGWGLDESDLDDMPPAIARGYAFPADSNFVKPTFLGALGEDIGQIESDDGNVIEAGRVMMRGQWNTAVHDKLAEVAEPQDIWIAKNRLSGFWEGTRSKEVLAALGIRTLLFSGENTDQCVEASMRDAYTRGWDAIMLSDACATTSPAFATQCAEYNCQGGWGFVMTCQQLIEGIDKIQKGP